MRANTKTRLKRGETLVETLTAVLIISLASVALATMISSSAKLNTAAKEKDGQLFSAITAIETQNTPASGTVTVTVGEGSTKTVNFSVDFYTDPQGILTAYDYGGGG